MTTIAGNGVHGYSGDGGPATSAAFAYPSGVAVDGFGNIYIADYENNRVRKVALDGTITTVAGTGAPGYGGDGGPAVNARLAFPYGVAVNAAGNLYIAETRQFPNPPRHSGRNHHHGSWERDPVRRHRRGRPGN